MAALSLGTAVDGDLRWRRDWPGPALDPVPGPVPVAPFALTAPALLGPGRIGTALEAAPGVWGGWPAPEVSLQWQRDGADIPGATGGSYVPGPGDDRALLRIRATAANAAGTAQAFSHGISIVYPAPVASGLPDLTFFQDSGVQIVNAFPAFTGSALTFSVLGDGVAVDPATGAVSIPTDVLRVGLEVLVSATNSGGTATSTFRVTVALPEIVQQAPALLAVPVLTGPALIGSAVEASPGVWSDAAAALAFQWRRDGDAIPGATDPAYVPGSADDLADLTCAVTATNAAGSTEAVTAALRVTYPAPEVTGDLADLTLILGDGPALVDGAAAFAGAALAYAVDGAGAAVDPATGAITVPGDVLRAAETVTVTATNSGGSATADFRVSVVSEVPVPLEAPVLSGTGRIGEEVTVETGTWSGRPAPELALQWRRDGAEIPGATGPSYVPGPQDDLADLTCLVTAINAGGSAAAETAPLAIVQAPPAVVASLGDLVLTQGSGVETVAAGAAFAGAALVFAATGAGAVIDAATGTLTLATDTPRDAEEVTVTATNSGGSASTRFRVMVGAALAAPEAVGEIGDVTFEQGGGVQTVSAQAGFAGEELVYTLDAAPEGASIHPASGLISIPTEALLEGATVIVRAANAAGAATQIFQVSVQPARAIAFVGQSYSGGVTVTMPPEMQAGDLCLVIATGISMGVPEGWIILHDDINANTSRRVVFACRFADSAGMASGTWAGANRLLAGVYRNLDPAAPIRQQVGGSAVTTGTTLVTYPEIAGLAPKSWAVLLQYTPSNNATVPAHPAMIDRRLAPGSANNHRLRLMDTDGPVDGLASATGDYLQNTGYQTVLIELACGAPVITLPPAPQDGDWDIEQVKVN